MLQNSIFKYCIWDFILMNIFLIFFIIILFNKQSHLPKESLNLSSIPLTLFSKLSILWDLEFSAFKGTVFNFSVIFVNLSAKGEEYIMDFF